MLLSKRIRVKRFPRCISCHASDRKSKEKEGIKIHVRACSSKSNGLMALSLAKQVNPERFRKVCTESKRKETRAKYDDKIWSPI